MEAAFLFFERKRKERTVQRDHPDRGKGTFLSDFASNFCR